MKLRNALIFLLSFASIRGEAQVQPTATIPQYALHLADPVMLPVGAPRALIGGAFGCTTDGSVFVQVISMPGAPGAGPAYGNVALYAVRSPTDIIQFHPELATGFKKLSPIARYFAGQSEVVGIAYGIPDDHSLAKNDPDPAKLRSVLLTFDRKGALQSANALAPGFMAQQVAAYASGDLLFAGWDSSRKKTRLITARPDGTAIREISIADEDDPTAVNKDPMELVDLLIYPYGQNLLLVPQDAHQPILEVNEAGVVRNYQLHTQSGLDRGMPLSFTPQSWKFSVMPEEPEGQKQNQPKPGFVLEFDPADGSILRKINLPVTGMQPACESDGEFTFLSSHAGDGKLQMIKGTVVN